MARSKRYSSRRRFRRRRRRFVRSRRKRTRLSRPVKRPFPKTFLFRTRYVDYNKSLNSSTLPTRYVYSCNGLYDPNISGTGHQPIGFDQIMPMYDHYTVIASKIRVETCLADDTTSSTGVVGVLVKDNDSIPVANLTQLMENGNFKKRIFPSMFGNGSYAAIKTGWSAKKWFPGSTLAQEKLSGTISSNPDEQCYYHIIVANHTTGAGDFRIAVTVTIDYIAVLNEPKVLTQS